MIFVVILIGLTVLFFIVEVFFGKKLDSIQISKLPEMLFPQSVDITSMELEGGQAYSGRRRRLPAKISSSSVNEVIVPLWALLVITAALGVMFYIILSHQFDGTTQTWATDTATGIITFFVGFKIGQSTKEHK